MGMTIRRATLDDVPLILQLLSATPNPPNEDEDSIAAILDDFDQFTYVDTTEIVVVRLAPRPDQRDDDGRPAPDVVVPWWIWEGDFQSSHRLVLGDCARAVLTAFPTAGSWPIWGDFPGDGNTTAARKADSRRQAREHRSWLGGDLTDKDSPNNAKMRQGRSTLGAVIAAIPAVS